MMAPACRSTGMSPVYLLPRRGPKGAPGARAAPCPARPARPGTSPARARREIGTSATVCRRGSATATATVPTGLAGVPPSGPAMPVMPTPMSAPDAARMPSAMARATGSLTAPCASSSAGVHAQHPGLDVVGVGHDGVTDVARAARHVGQPRRHQAARAGFGRRHGQTPRRQQLADDFLQALAVHAEDVGAEQASDLAWPPPTTARAPLPRTGGAPTGAARSGRARPGSSRRSAVSCALHSR